MFRALTCPSSGGKIVFTQHLVSSPFMRYGKILWNWRGHRLQYEACALHTGYQKLHTHSEYWIFIAFPLKQWLHERASMLHYTFIVLYAHYIPVHQASLSTDKNFNSQDFNHYPFLTYSDITYIILTEIIIIFNCYGVAATQINTILPLYSPWRWSR